MPTQKFSDRISLLPDVHSRFWNRGPEIRQIGKNDELTDHLCRTENALQFLFDFYYRNSSWNKEYVKVRCAEIAIPIPVYFITRRNFPFARISKLIRKQTFQQEISAY